MITDKDVKKLEQVFSTKEDIKKLRDDILIFKDQILGEIENLRANSAINEGIHDQVEDHEIRLEKIEKHLNRSS